MVGAAIVRDGRVLAARRTAPASAAGRWEFPGGKVEPGETEAESLVREIDEELGVRITVERWLEGEQPIGERYVLRVALASLDGGEPGADRARPGPLAGRRRAPRRGLAGRRPTLPDRAVRRSLPRLDG